MTYTSSRSASPDPRDGLPAPTDGDRHAERLAAEGWPVLRGSAVQRDARFVKRLLKAQLAGLRSGR